MGFRWWSILCLLCAGGCVANAEAECTCDDDKGPLPTEELSEAQQRVVLAYAPVVFQETRPEHAPPSLDMPTRIDFDGDAIGNNNEENIRIEPTPPLALYYAIVETETHYFLTYSIFHALDWSTSSPLIPYSWHENDMENLQVVVQKTGEDREEGVVLIAAQAHLWTTFVRNPDLIPRSTGFASRELVLLDEEGRAGSWGTHPAVVVRAGGHAIYDLAREIEVHPGDLPEVESSVRLLPAGLSTAAFDAGNRYEEDRATLRYDLLSTHDAFYLPYLRGEQIGDGQLFDGELNYQDELVSHFGLPRHFDSDRLSGPGKRDAGILPFAFSSWLTSRDLGVLFFNPAKKYVDEFSAAQDWSRVYLYHPYMGSLLVG